MICQHSFPFSCGEWCGDGHGFMWHFSVIRCSLQARTHSWYKWIVSFLIQQCVLINSASMPSRKVCISGKSVGDVCELRIWLNLLLKTSVLHIYIAYSETNITTCNKIFDYCTKAICDWILENLNFGHINQSDVIVHISYEKEAFGVKLHSKKI